MALRRLKCLENKLLQNSELLQIFRDTISKYISKGYIRKLDVVDGRQVDSRIWYLPIFAVFNKNKPGKSRVVWDAAAKVGEHSLNSFLLKGPDMLASLPSILFKFRQKKVAVCGDIEEMFHQIHIRPEDRNVQRFLWRDCNREKSPDVYVMDVMIFGASCAPSISQFVKNFNADKFVEKYPIAVKAIKENHYVDDLLDSVATDEKALQLINDVTYVHSQGGFNIRNRVSNSELVRNTYSNHIAHSAKCINDKDEDNKVEKVLGVFWEQYEDVITFKISPWLMNSELFMNQRVPTKREVLRLVMSIYDRLGLIGHITMYVKILMQKVWRSKIGWDEPIPTPLLIKWAQWLQILPSIQNIKIERCYLKCLKNYDGVELQLHTFVDASKDAYAAVCYFRLKQNEHIVCSLISAKSRVAPMKITSVPRLELMAALIGARLSKFICDNHEIVISKKYFWSDSKTVLSWINSDHRKYNQFVAFRITEILEITSASDWNWVCSSDNVADDATKWAKIPTDTGEERIRHIHHISKREAIYDELRFSKWNRLLRAVGYVYKFIAVCRKTTYRYEGLSHDDLAKAEIKIYKQVQSEYYSAEISALGSSCPVSKSSEIYAKSPYLDNGVLRVEGRIDLANVTTEQKRPIILPRNSYTTKLIIMHYHEHYHHLNNETVVNEIRQKYSISKLRATVKSVVRCCQLCKISKVIPKNPQMGRLPHARVAAYAAPFSYTGLDFFGPILVTVNRHKEKRYGCLFTCLTIRAVHIEVAHSLTTSSCILVIRNFMARRGTPREFYSDNGTNFIGAERELREAISEVDKNELIKAFTTVNTKWIFNPPASPHMGSAWERLVRSVKVVLYKIMPSRYPTDELLLSMLIEVENVINSRPLTYVPVDEDTEEALTPNHFLTGSSNGLKPMSTLDDSGVLLKRNWLISQQYGNIFWKKWLAEYLPSLTCRTKWHEKSKPLGQGDLVIIVDPSLPRNVWLRGRVLETRLAQDGQVRSATVMTKRGIMERPVTKLAILDVAGRNKSDNEETSCHTPGGMLTLNAKSP
ncbi:uncharacterized protein LOC142235544 [Haematobia irritans]|uniref:uncharacterized protein LOC142235544 n=1 Tax=Haematobia irritans TaxID=7368 RepID=UPI003F4F5126